MIPQIGDADRATLEPLLDLKIKTPSGEMVPVSTFTRIETSVAPRTLNRFQQANAVRVFGGVQPGVTKAEGLDVLEDAAKAAGGERRHRGLRRRVAPDPRGRRRAHRDAGLRADPHLPGARRAVPELPRSADRVAGSVPLAISGALVFTFLDWTTLNIYSQVGLITLVGLIAKNGILIVEFANKLQAHGPDR